MKTASCLCGDVRFKLRGALDGIIACHCTQCRRQTGHHWASTHTADADLHFVARESLRWYRSSAGAINGPTGLRLAGHIFVADAGDYYEVAGGAYLRDRA